MSDALVRIGPAEAHQKMIDEGYVYVDVRSPDEFAEGRPAGAINIPIEESSISGASAPQAFVASICALFAKDAKLIIGCQAGARSLRAAEALISEGFENIVEQRAGFDASRGAFGEILEPGWRRCGLPQEED